MTNPTDLKRLAEDVLAKAAKGKYYDRDLSTDFMFLAANAAPQLAQAWLDAQAENAMLKDMMANTAGFDFASKDAEIARQRAALEMAREAIAALGDITCPWCDYGFDFSLIHTPDCQRQRAIAAIEDALR